MPKLKYFLTTEEGSFLFRGICCELEYLLDRLMKIYIFSINQKSRFLMEIKEIENGFYLYAHKNNDSDFAYFSLNLALQSYSSTYQSIIKNENSYSAKFFELDIPESAYTKNYIQNCVETIIHLHHFFELIIKNALRSEHELLATIYKEKDLDSIKLFYFLKDNPATSNNSRSLDFGKSLNRICDLIKADLIHKQFHFFIDQEPFLKGLNLLRNRLMHRGTFIIRYEALDSLMIKYAIPLINLISQKKFYAKKSIRYGWKYKPMACGIDPLSELPKCFFNNYYEKKRVALLKEMMRASYFNPINIEYNEIPSDFMSIGVLKGNTFDNESNIKKAKSIANLLLMSSTKFSYGNMIFRISKCPICSINPY